MSDPIAEFLDDFPHATWASTGDEAAAAIRARLAPEFAAAERRGYAEAVARLRDEQSFLDWLFPPVIPHRDDWRNNMLAAAYLEAEATKETTDHA